MHNVIQWKLPVKLVKGSLDGPASLHASHCLMSQFILNSRPSSHPPRAPALASREC
jgi:hypothetical protein